MSMDPTRKYDANRKYSNDALFKNVVDQLVASYNARVYYPDDMKLAVELAEELFNARQVLEKKQ